MTLLGALKAVGKGIEHAIPWIVDGLKVAGEVAAVVDPPLGAPITAIEGVLGAVPQGNQAMTASQLQTLVTAIAAAYAMGVKAQQAPAVAP